MDIIMKTFYGEDGNYTDIPLEEILKRITDDWIDDNSTGENISELRDACIKQNKRIKELEAELTEARDWLKYKAMHTDGCEVELDNGKTKNCTCGLDELLAERE